MRIRNILSVVALAVMVAVSAAGAQQRHQRQGMRAQEAMDQNEQGMGQMLAMMGLASPEQLLAHREELQLNDEQVASLTELQTETAATVQEAMASHEQHKTQLHEVLSAGTIDQDAVLMHMEAAHAAMGTAHRTELQAALAALDILTEEQHAKAKDLFPASGMGHGMMGGQGTQHRNRHRNQR